jgi:D-glycero-alpha-D-manno-heptose 1-phosphate guanylyltransferase
MKAVILAGGKGTRLRDVIKDIPKPMSPVNGRPFLEYLVMQLVKWDIRELIFSIGYKGEIIRSYFDNGSKWGVRIEYSEETEPLGTGGAIRKAAGLIDGEHFAAMNGDSFLDIDFKALAAFHRETSASVTIGLAEVDDSGRYGSVEVNEKGEVERFAEKGREGKGLINGGVYIFKSNVVNAIPPGLVSLETDFLPAVIKNGLFGMAVRGYFMDIGIPEDYMNICVNPERLQHACRTLQLYTKGEVE